MKRGGEVSKMFRIFIQKRAISLNSLYKLRLIGRLYWTRHRHLSPIRTACLTNRNYCCFHYTVRPISDFCQIVSSDISRLLVPPGGFIFETFSQISKIKFIRIDFWKDYQLILRIIRGDRSNGSHKH